VRTGRPPLVYSWVDDVLRATYLFGRDVSVNLDPRALAHARAGSMAFGVLLASGVALVLGLFRLGVPSIWLDEAATARGINEGYPDVFLRYHWLFYSIEKPWTSVAGTSEWALRLPAVFGAVLACGLLVVLAQKLFDRWVALISGLFLASNPFFVTWSQQARGYTLLVAVGILSALLLIRALERRSRGAWFAYGLAFSVVLMLHPVAGLTLVPAHAIFIFQRRDHVVRHALLGACVIVALGMSWVTVVAIYTGGESEAIRSFPAWETVARALGKNSGAIGFGIILAIIGFWVLGRSGRLRLAVWLGAWAFGPFVIVLTASTVHPLFIDRYVMMAAPPFALLAGVALRGLGTRLRLAATLVVVVATSIGLVQWYSEGSNGNNWHGENWRGAVAMVFEKRGHDGPVLIIPPFARAGPEYYGAEWVVVAPASDSVWALMWSETGHDLSDSDRQAYGLGRYVLVERQQFGWRLSAQHWVRER
jgi:mannosyltransferase